VLETLIGRLRAAGAEVDSEARPELTLAEAHENYLALLLPLMIAEVPPEALAGLASLSALAAPSPAEEAFALTRAAASRAMSSGCASTNAASAIARASGNSFSASTCSCAR